MTVISYPIPPFSNVAIESQYYTPSRFVISAITLGKTTIITTTSDHNYEIGNLVRLIIPPTFGTRQLNETQSYVISLPSSTEVELNIDSSQMNAYISSSATTKAQILAIGDVNNGTSSTNGVNITPTIPGSFYNISP